METTLLKCKLHHARVTHVELEYEGSCAIDGDLLTVSGLREYEQIQIYNIDNGERFSTYVIRAENGTGTISINGAAAYKASRGDRIIICSYVSSNDVESISFKPKLIGLDEKNIIISERNTI